MVLIPIAILSACLLLMCLSIHICSHFLFNIRFELKPVCNISKPIQQCTFYPLSWTLYTLFLLIISSTILITKLLNTNNQIITLCVPYTVIVLSCFESLFSFHRYYSVRSHLLYKQKMDTKTILFHFLILFAFPYAALFASALYFIPYLYPLIMTIHIVFNIFCQFKFVQMVLAQYSQLQSFDDTSASNVSTSMIQSIYIMGYCSSISICITAFPIYFAFIHVPTAEFLLCPLFWSISSLLYMFNFVRNRTLTAQKLHKIYSCVQKSNDSVNQNANQNANEPETDTQPMEQTKNATAFAVDILNVSDLTAADSKVPDLMLQMEEILQPELELRVMSVPDRVDNKIPTLKPVALSNPILNGIINDNTTQKDEIPNAELKKLEKHSLPSQIMTLGDTQNGLKDFMSEPMRNSSVYSMKLLKKYENDINDDKFKFVDQSISPVYSDDKTGNIEINGFKLDNIVIMEESIHDQTTLSTQLSLDKSSMKSINFLAESGFCFFIDFNLYNHMTNANQDGIEGLDHANTDHGVDFAALNILDTTKKKTQPKFTESKSLPFIRKKINT
eukprot:43905_1